MRCLVVSHNAALATLTLSLAGLTHLFVNNNEQIKMVNLNQTPKLEVLHVQFNEKLTTLDGVDNLVALTELKIVGNPELQGQCSTSTSFAARQHNATTCEIKDNCVFEEGTCNDIDGCDIKWGEQLLLLIIIFILF